MLQDVRSRHEAENTHGVHLVILCMLMQRLTAGSDKGRCLLMTLLGAARYCQHLNVKAALCYIEFFALFCGLVYHRVVQCCLPEL